MSSAEKAMQSTSTTPRATAAASTTSRRCAQCPPLPTHLPAKGTVLQKPALQAKPPEIGKPQGCPEGRGS